LGEQFIQYLVSDTTIQAIVDPQLLRFGSWHSVGGEVLRLNYAH
jgi:hypothetical protein